MSLTCTNLGNGTPSKRTHHWIAGPPETVFWASPMMASSTIIARRRISGSIAAAGVLGNSATPAVPAERKRIVRFHTNTDSICATARLRFAIGSKLPSSACAAQLKRPATRRSSPALGLA